MNRIYPSGELCEHVKSPREICCLVNCINVFAGHVIRVMIISPVIAFYN